MKPKYEPGWSIPYHGNYCDHYATAIGDPNTCGRCGATRLIPLGASVEGSTVDRDVPPAVGGWSEPSTESPTGRLPATGQGRP